MRLKQFQLGRIYGIPLIIDYSWPPVALLHIWVVSRFWMVAEVQPPLPLWQNLIIGSDHYRALLRLGPDPRTVACSSWPGWKASAFKIFNSTSSADGRG